MRSQRSYMVQTTEQYQFVYSALTEHTLFGNTEFEIEEIDNILDEGVRELPGGVNGFSHQVIKKRNKMNKALIVVFIIYFH